MVTKKKYRKKNVYCENTKLTENEFCDLVFDYCGFFTAPMCAKNINRSRQTVQGIFTKIGERITYLFETNDFPNFSSSTSIEMMEDDPMLRELFSCWIRPKIYDLKLICSSEGFPEKLSHQNTVAVTKSLDGLFIIRIFDHFGEKIDYNKVPINLILELESAFKESPDNLQGERRLVQSITSSLQYTQKKTLIYDEIVPTFSYEEYLDYKINGIILPPNCSTVYHARYRILQNMVLTEKALRGFSKEKFSNYISRARLFELMIFLCKWAQQKHNLLKDKKTSNYARNAAYILIMVSLRFKPLSLK